MKWYEWPSCKEALARIGRSFLGPKQFEFHISDPSKSLKTGPENPVGYTDLTSNKVVVSPATISRAMPSASPQEQYEASLGVMAHEVGHGRYTSRDPKLIEGVVGRLTNILEDERIDRIMCGKYSMIRKPMRQSNAALLNLNGEVLTKRMADTGEAGKLCSADDPTAVGDYLLRRLLAGKAGKLGQFEADTELHENQQDNWDKVWPIAQRSFEADTTEEVRKCAEEIWEILGLKEEEPEDGDSQGDPRDGDGEKTAAPPPRGSDADEPEKPGDDDRWDPDNSEGDGELTTGVPDGAKNPYKADGAGSSGGGVRHIHGMNFEWLEDAARPLANRLAGQLLLPVFHTPEDYAPRGSRVSVRAAIKTRFEQPFLADTRPVPDGHQLAFSWCTDVSGSMGLAGRPGGRYRMAQITSAMLHMLAVELDIWHTNWAFGDYTWCPIPPGASEEDGLARIAGLGDHGGTDLCPALERSLNELRARPEAVRVCFVIHDGGPDDPSGTRDMIEGGRRDGIEVIGVGVMLGSAKRYMSDMFGMNDYIDCGNIDDLPVKLGNAVNSLHQVAQQRLASMMRVGG